MAFIYLLPAWPGDAALVGNIQDPVKDCTPVDLCARHEASASDTYGGAFELTDHPLIARGNQAVDDAFAARLMLHVMLRQPKTPQ